MIPLTINGSSLQFFVPIDTLYTFNGDAVERSAIDDRHVLRRQLQRHLERDEELELKVPRVPEVPGVPRASFCCSSKGSD